MKHSAEKLELIPRNSNCRSQVFVKKKSGKFLLEQFPLTSTSYLKEVGQMVSFSGGSATRGVTFAVVTRLKEKRQSYRNEA